MMMDMPCSKCKEPLSFEVPVPQIVNQITFSMVMLSHERPQVCPKCNTFYVPFIQDINDGIKVIFMPLQKKNESNIVAPSGKEMLEVNRSKGASIALIPGA